MGVFPEKKFREEATGVALMFYCCLNVFTTGSAACCFPVMRYDLEVKSVSLPTYTLPANGPFQRDSSARNAVGTALQQAFLYFFMKRPHTFSQNPKQLQTRFTRMRAG